MNSVDILLVNCAYWILAVIYLAAMIVKWGVIPRIREGGPMAEAG